MPTSVRKSSVGIARRGPIKPYLPYRGNAGEVGKRTGLTIPQVERKSDGFEPFEEVLRRMDDVMPLMPKRKKSIVPIVNPEYDEMDGEMSMQLDSPVSNLGSMCLPISPTTLNRVGSTSRLVVLTANVDFDRIPFPNPRSQSKANYGPDPSNLSNSTSRREVAPESDSPYEGGGYDDGGQNNVDMDVDDGNGGFDAYYGPQQSC